MLGSEAAAPEGSVAGQVLQRPQAEGPRRRWRDPAQLQLEARDLVIFSSSSFPTSTLLLPFYYLTLPLAGILVSSVGLWVSSRGFFVAVSRAPRTALKAS